MMEITHIIQITGLSILGLLALYVILNMVIAVILMRRD